MNKLNKTKTIALLIAFIFISGISLISIKSLNQDKTKEYHQKLELEEHAREYEQLIYQTKNIVLPGWSELSIYADIINQESGIDFFNPKSNLFYRCPKCLDLTNNNTCLKCHKEYKTDELIEDLYYLTFKLILDDTNEVLYQSNLVYPGLHIQKIDLSRTLKEGDYKATVLMDAYAKDRYTQFNSGEVKLILHARKRI